MPGVAAKYLPCRALHRTGTVMRLHRMVLPYDAWFGEKGPTGKANSPSQCPYLYCCDGSLTPEYCNGGQVG